MIDLAHWLPYAALLAGFVVELWLALTEDKRYGKR